MKILALEPYYGGSHRAFLDDLCRHLPFEFTLLTQPARGWKWRMRFSAPWFAEQVQDLDPGECDVILASSLFSLAEFKGLVPGVWRRIPSLVYWHENQWAYPVQKEDQRDVHFLVTHLTTLMAADLNLFNSAWNLDSLFQGLEYILKKVPDTKMPHTLSRLREKSRVMPPCLDRPVAGTGKRLPPPRAPRILWNHRWEFDKNPEEFFQALFGLADRGVPFELVVTGQEFAEAPAIFARARSRLASHIVHWGHVEDRRHYEDLLQEVDIVVSTARHEFFGLAVLEAALAGALPLVPRQLAYPEIYPADCLYTPGDLQGALEELLPNMDTRQMPALDQFLWSAQKPLWEKVFRDLAATADEPS